MAAKTPPCEDFTIPVSSNITGSRMKRSGSGDSLLLQRRAARQYQHRTTIADHPERDFATGNATFHHASTGSLSSFVQQQQRRAIKKGQRTSGLLTSNQKASSPDQHKRTNAVCNQSLLSLSSGGDKSGGYRSSARLRDALGLISPRPSTHPSVAGVGVADDMGDSKQNLFVAPLSDSPTGGLRSSHKSAPDFLALQHQRPSRTFGSGGHCHSTIGKSSTGNLSAASMSSQSSGGSLTLKGNAVMQVAQRSNGSTVKSVIAHLKDMVREHKRNNDQHGRGSDQQHHSQSEAGAANEDDTATDRKVDMPPPPPPPPRQEMALLSQWSSVDAYYVVVISKYQGIPTILNIMKLYPEVEDVQVYGLITLIQMNNQAQIQQCGGVQVCLQAMQRHQSTIEVVSEGFGLLKRQAALLAQEDRDQLLSSLKSLVAAAKSMYLTQTGKEGLAFCEQFLEMYSSMRNLQPEGTTASATNTTASAALTRPIAENNHLEGRMGPPAVPNNNQNNNYSSSQYY